MRTLSFSLFLLCAAAIFPATAENPFVSNRFAKLEFHDGAIHLCEPSGRPVLSTGALNFAWSPPEALPVNAEKINGETLRVRYKIRNDATGKVTVTGLFELKENRVACRYEIFAPGLQTGGIMQKITPADGVETGKLYKAGIWTRVPGGTSYEKRGEMLKKYSGETIGVWHLVRGNHLWSSYDNEHLAVRQLDDGKYLGETLLEIYPVSMDNFEAAAANRGEPVALRLGTTRKFNLFEQGQPEFQAEISNTSGHSLSGVRVRFIARDYDGKSVLDKQEILSLSAGEKCCRSFKLPAGRNIFFVDACATVAGKEYFTRTNIATLPPHQYQNPRREIGISAFFDEPDREAVFQLMQRIGVRNLRNNDNREAARYGMTSYMHNNVSNDRLYDPERDYDTLRKMLDQYREWQCAGWEFCNEWNFCNTPEQRKTNTAIYASWLKAIREEAARRGQKIHLISLGLSGADQEWLRELKRIGAWELIDGVALHPGRGNMMADCLGSGWFYLGSVRRINETLKELGGDKPLYLTEVYASTRPNNWWNDSYRLAADNTLLTLALGIAEKAATIQFYQLHDGVWYDVCGVNENDGEFNFGMLMRDTSPKPQLLAFAAAAEALDGAEFLRYLELPEKVHGMEFDTPRGKMAVLYDRTEGYFQSEKKEGFVWPEPWVKHWQKFNVHAFRSSQREVVTVDAIGRKENLPVKNGRVELTLSGSPLIVYGLDLP